MALVITSTGATYNYLRDPYAISIGGLGTAWIAGGDCFCAVQLGAGGGVESLVTYLTVSSINQPLGVAVDASNNAWISSLPNTLTEVSSTGTVLSGSSRYTGGGLTAAGVMAIDPLGNIWVVNDGDNVVEFSNAGVVLSGAAGYPAGKTLDLNFFAFDPSGNGWFGDTSSSSGYAVKGVTENTSSGTLVFTGTTISVGGGVAVDSLNDIWVADYFGNDLVKLSDTGTVLSGPGGYTGGGLSDPSTAAIDGAGDV